MFKSNGKLFLDISGLDLPAVGLDQDMINLYLEAMDDEKEKIHNIRLIVVGNEGVGKTTLCRRLMGQSIQGVKSTNGIDIKQRIVVNLNTGERSFVENGMLYMSKAYFVINAFL